MEITGKPTLAQLRRIMTEHPADMDDEVLGWAIGCLKERIDMLPGHGAQVPMYQQRLATLQQQELHRA